MRQAAENYDDKLAGHVSVRDRDDGTLLVPRVGARWGEFSVDDVVRIDAEGSVVEGEGNLNPTIVFHFELHKARPDIVCAIHNHPPSGNIWACAGELPPLHDQTGAIGGGPPPPESGEYSARSIVRERVSSDSSAFVNARMTRSPADSSAGGCFVRR